MSTESPSLLTSFRLLVGLVVSTAPARSALMFVLAVLDGALTPAVVAVTGIAVNRARDTAGAGLDSPAGHDLVLVLVLIGVLFAAGQTLDPIRNSVAASIGSAMGQVRRERLLAVTLRPPGIAHLEDPELADEVRRAGDVEWDVGPLTRIVEELGQAVTAVTASLGAAVLLIDLAWWVPLVLIAGALLTHVAMIDNERDQVMAVEKHATSQRRADYLRDLALDPPAAKETRLFGLSTYLADESRRSRLNFLTELWRVRRLTRGATLRTTAIVAITHLVVLAYLAHATIDGAVDVGALTVFLQAIPGVAMLSYGAGAVEMWWVHQGSATIPHLLGLERRSLTTTSTGTHSAAGTPKSEIRLEGVRFGYPGRPVLDSLDLTIPAGSSLAIVGVNGAGKTTLLKLLAGLYEPAAGRITVDGRDLRDYDIESWRRQIAVIFQDFVRYELSARDNVALGRAPDDDALRRAASRAGALDVVESLPAGWDTTLARQYPGGADLSGGQWQRIALARALRAAEAGARLLVLDEPTANLDVRAEAALFDRFLELTAGTTTLLVTHRLSTVRHANRIAVLESGRVAELGTHVELLAADGLYARLFRLQANRFAHGVTDD